MPSKFSNQRILSYAISGCRDKASLLRNAIHRLTAALGTGLPDCQTQNTNLGKFWRALQWKILVYFTAIWYILWPFGILYGHLVYCMVNWYILWPFGIFYGHLVCFTYGRLVYFMAIWYIFGHFVVSSYFGMLYQLNSGNSGCAAQGRHDKCMKPIPRCQS
jgi:hypothetical protein